MTKFGRRSSALDETIDRLRTMADEAQVIADSGQKAALTHHLLKMGRTLYSAISLAELDVEDRVIDLTDTVRADRSGR